MKKKILIICCTHGNEKIGYEVVKKLKSEKLDKFFDYLIANPKAVKRNVRFVEADLNRSYPGINNSPIYEKNLAYKNLQIAKKYQYVVDIHEASQGINNFIIIPRKEIPKQLPLNLVNLRTVLLWPNPKGPLGSVLKNTFELEFGMKGKKREIVVGQAQKTVEDFIKRFYAKKPGCLLSKNIYYVYGKLYRKGFPFYERKIKDFKKIKILGESFYPLLTKQYLSENIVCYKMKKM
jgi:hypothetical protein